RRQVWQQITDVLAALAMLPPVPGTLHACARRALKQLDSAAGVELGAVPFDQLGLVIEGIKLAGRPGHEELNDALCLGPVVWTAGALRSSRTCLVAVEEPGQRDAAQSAADLPEP